MPGNFTKAYHSAVLVGIALLMGCKPVQKSLAPENSINQSIATKIGLNYKSYPSPNGSYILFIEKLNPSAANPITKFIVIESASQKVVIEKSFRPGYVKWVKDSVLEFLDTPGIVKQDEDLSSYIKEIDIASLKN